MGRSNPDDEVCKHTPRSAEPVNVRERWDYFTRLKKL